MINNFDDERCIAIDQLKVSMIIIFLQEKQTTTKNSIMKKFDLSYYACNVLLEVFEGEGWIKREIVSDGIEIITWKEFSWYKKFICSLDTISGAIIIGIKRMLSRLGHNQKDEFL